MSSLQKGVKTPMLCFFPGTPALKDRVSDFPYLAKYLILTPSFMAGSKHRNKMGFPPATLKINKTGRAGIPIRPFRGKLNNIT